MRHPLRLSIVAIAALCAVMFSVSYHTAQAAVAIDGTMNETEWVSLGTSAGGPTPGFGAGHEINALSVYNDFNYLYVGVAGNVQARNRIVVLMDTRSGGYADGNFGREGNKTGRLVERVGELDQTEYRTKRLERGKTYFWRVISCAAGACRRSPWSFFRIKGAS